MSLIGNAGTTTDPCSTHGSGLGPDLQKRQSPSSVTSETAAARDRRIHPRSLNLPVRSKSLRMQPSTIDQLHPPDRTNTSTPLLDTTQSLPSDNFRQRNSATSIRPTPSAGRERHPSSTSDSEHPTPDGPTLATQPTPSLTSPNTLPGNTPRPDELIS